MWGTCWSSFFVNFNTNSTLSMWLLIYLTRSYLRAECVLFTLTSPIGPSIMLRYWRYHMDDRREMALHFIASLSYGWRLATIILHWRWCMALRNKPEYELAREFLMSWNKKVKKKMKMTLSCFGDFAGGSVIKNPLAVQEIRVWSLGR